MALEVKLTYFHAPKFDRAHVDAPNSDRVHEGNTTTYDQRGPIRAMVFRRVWPHSGRCRRPRSCSLPLHASPPIAHTAPPLPPACCQTGWPGTARGEPRNPAAEMFVYGDLGKAAKSALMCGSCRPVRRFRDSTLWVSGLLAAAGLLCHQRCSVGGDPGVPRSCVSARVPSTSW